MQNKNFILQNKSQAIYCLYWVLAMKNINNKVFSDEAKA